MLHDLEEAAASLSKNYRSGKWKLTEQEKLAYVLCRMPATSAVLQLVLSQIEFSSLLDLGAGPGTSSFATSEEVELTCVERELDFIKLAKKYEARGSWHHSDLTTYDAAPHDIVLFSYSYGELSNVSLAPFWEKANKALIIIEPGTPDGYQTILRVRQELLDLGGHVYAPCPHNRLCPMKSPDWCHFGALVERTQLHRRLKQGTLPYEEEKFSYVIMSKESRQEHLARLLAHPDKRSGHMLLKLCTEDGIETRTVTKRKTPDYKELRKKRWGETL